jgi:hypothetical protein
LVLPQTLGDTAVYLVLALTIFSLSPFSLFHRLPSHLVPDLLFNSSLLFSPLCLFLFLLHLSRPQFDPSCISDVPVVGLLLLSLALLPRFPLSAYCVASCYLHFDPFLKLSLFSLFFSLLFLATTLFLGSLILKLLQPPCNFGPDELLALHSSVPPFLFTPPSFLFAPHSFLFLGLSSLLFPQKYRSAQLHCVIFCREQPKS